MAVKAGVIGWPIGHSLSPKIFSLISRRLDYRAVAVRPEALEEALRGFSTEGWAGVNVTIPHKRAVMTLIRSLTPEARAIGAVNAVRFSRRGAKGHNTDAAGFADALREANFSPIGRTAVVFGAGGAARAVGWTLGRLGASRVILSARHQEKAAQLAADLGRLFPATKFSSGKPKSAALWINATPLGMKGFPARSPAQGPLRGCLLAFDLVYGHRTPFLRQAVRQGAQALDGTSMLVFQALRSWEFWRGPLTAARRRALKEAIIAELR